MKRHLISAACIALAVCLCACGKPKTADPDDYGYTLTQQDNGTYTLQVEANDGSTLYLRERLTEEPQCLALNTDTLQIVGNHDSGTQWAVFCNVAEDKVSDAIGNYVTANDTKVAYVDYLTDAYHLFVRDIYDETLYLEAVTLTGLVVQEDGALVTDAKLKNGKLTVTYYTTVGKANAIIEMPE